MINQHYYLVASLPHLAFGKQAPISREAFLSECQKWLDSRSLRMVEKLDLNDISPGRRDSDVVREWKEFEFDLRSELAKIRRSRKEGAKEHIPLFLKGIFEEDTPLLMERRFEEKRWEFLEEKEFGLHFDLRALFVYFLKLQILERLSRFDKEKGKAVFDGLCEVKV